MKVAENQWARLQFLSRITLKECQYLQETDERLFSDPHTIEFVHSSPMDALLAERLDAFVSRFSRLQDNLGDKLLPQLLDAMGEKTGAALENLDRAEKLGWIASADAWMTMRRLRNQMVHEYIEDAMVLKSALQAGHRFVPVLLDAANRLTTQITKLSPA